MGASLDRSQHTLPDHTRRRSRSESYARSLQSQNCMRPVELNKGGARSFVCGPIRSTQSSSPTNVDIAVTMVTSPRALKAILGSSQSGLKFARNGQNSEVSEFLRIYDGRGKNSQNSQRIRVFQLIREFKQFANSLSVPRPST